jgi:prepilin-type N-terminal cleavage/methylation domain-containing protein
MKNITENQRAFTLIEMLITMTILSILTAIALPQYNSYKKQAFDMRALSDLRSVAIAEEAYFMQEEKYLDCSGSGCLELPGMTAVSKGVELSVTISDEGFLANSYHPMGSGKKYLWDSLKGGLQDN